MATTIIPLRLIEASGNILWNNRTPQSIRFCRPLKLEYTKETKEIILKEKENIEEEINSLSAFEVSLGEKKLCALHLSCI